MVHWLWIPLAFGAGWWCCAKFLKIGFSKLVKSGVLKVQIPK